MKEQQKLSPFRAGKQSGWCGAICTIDHYIKYLEAGKPIVGGSWNPNEYVRKDLFDDFVARMKEQYPEGLDPSDKEHILWCSEGETFKNPEWQQYAVDIEYVLDNWIEDFVGPEVDGFQTKCPMFGPIGGGEKYIAVHYYKNGAILIKGHKDHHGEISMRWVMFFPESVWNAMGISCSDVSDYYSEDNEETVELDQPEEPRPKTTMRKLIEWLEKKEAEGCEATGGVVIYEKPDGRVMQVVVHPDYKRITEYKVRKH